MRLVLRLGLGIVFTEVRIRVKGIVFTEVRIRVKFRHITPPHLTETLVPCSRAHLT